MFITIVVAESTRSSASWLSLLIKYLMVYIRLIEKWLILMWTLVGFKICPEENKSDVQGLTKAMQITALIICIHEIVTESFEFSWCQICHNWWHWCQRFWWRWLNCNTMENYLQLTVSSLWWWLNIHIELWLFVHHHGDKTLLKRTSKEPVDTLVSLVKAEIMGLG